MRGIINKGEIFVMEFIEVSAKTVNDAVTDALVRLGVTSDQLEYEVISEGSTGFLGFGSKPAVIKVRKKYSPEESVREFLNQVFEAMKLDVEILINYDEENSLIEVEFKGVEMGVLIGKRGQTLDSLQYLTNLALNKQSYIYLNFKWYTEYYLKRLKYTLENLAKKI